METLSALCIPKEDNQIQLYASTQWIDFTQNLVAAALGIQINQIDMQVRRLGGGYGGKATPSFFLATATAVASWKVNKPVRYVCMLGILFYFFLTSLNIFTRFHGCPSWCSGSSKIN